MERRTFLKITGAAAATTSLVPTDLHAAQTGKGVLVEAESFADRGGWVLDTQFITTMGSPYLLAHGMGVPVANAKTSVTFPAAGKYRLWVRTKNWVEGDWDPPGRFKVIVGSQQLETTFGTERGWAWQRGDRVEVPAGETTVQLKDLTGFDGRCDALYFTKEESNTPPNDLKELAKWRDRIKGVPAEPTKTETYDLVIVGGGIAGCAAALAADRQGLKVALVQDRPLLGGNASSEIRVHTIGIHGVGGELLKGIDTRHYPNGSAEAIKDQAKRQKTMDAARNVKKMTNWRATGVVMDGKKIQAVDAFNTITGQTRRLAAPVFIDATGDGWLGYWAGAEFRYGRESYHEFGERWEKHGERWSPEKPDKLTMGTSVLFNSYEADEPTTFPDVPWAMDVAGKQIATKNDWFWEYASGDTSQIADAEWIRDHMLRAIYGSFANAKKNPKNARRTLTWVGYVGGKRESRRIMGDHIFTEKDALARTKFDDAVVMEKRELDVHYQRSGPADFLSHALFRGTGGMYYVPFRSLYSKDIENLMMAGRCFSCSHIGLGGPRVMLTCGQMGIATGFAASLCVKNKTTPRGVYQEHIEELKKLIGC